MNKTTFQTRLQFFHMKQKYFVTHTVKYNGMRCTKIALFSVVTVGKLLWASALVIMFTNNTSKYRLNFFVS
jgi:hypothetical protein